MSKQMDLITFVETYFKDVKIQPYQKEVIKTLDKSNIKIIQPRISYKQVVKEYYKCLDKLRKENQNDQVNRTSRS